MSPNPDEIVTMARNARVALGAGLSALQSDPTLPPPIAAVAESLAQAMSALHRIESSNGRELMPHADVALRNVRAAVSTLQAQSPSGAAMAHAVDAVGGALGLVHALVGRAVPREADEPLPDEMLAGLKPPFVVRHKWKVLGALLFVASAAAVGAYVRFRPSKEDRFADTPFGSALGDPLTKFSGDTHGLDLERAAAREQLLSAAVQKQIGADAVQDLAAVLDGAAAYDKSSEAEDDRDKSLFASINVLDHKLWSRNVPAHLSAYTFNRSVSLLAYAVHTRALLTFGSVSLRTVRGARLDDGPFADFVAYRPAHAEWVVVSMEAVEAEFLRNELDAIVHGVLAKPGDVGDTEKTPKAEILRHAGGLVADELLAGSKLTRDDAAAIDGKLSQRNDWIDHLKEDGLILDRNHLVFTRPVAARLAQWRKDLVVDQVAKLDTQLQGYRGVVNSAVDLLAALVEDEFVVKLLEEERLKDSSIAALKDAGVDDAELRAIVSAELAKLSRAQPCPRLALWRAAEYAFGNQYSGWAHAAGRVMLNALLKELSISAVGFARGDLTDADFDTALRALLDKPPEEVRAAASRAYQTIFGAPPAPLTRSST